MSEDLNKAQQEPTVEPAAEPVSEPETQSAAPETEPAEQAKDDGKKKDGWFSTAASAVALSRESPVRTRATRVRTYPAVVTASTAAALRPTCTTSK